MNKNIKSGDDYAKVIIATMRQTEKKTPENERTPIELLHFWFREIEILADKKWMDYILGKCDTYIFSDTEMMKLYDKANELYTQETLNSLVDKDLVKVEINENGDMMYSITEEGKKVVGSKIE